ncbi:heparan-alpha-glucosaminide N-acetyltransferase [Nitratireductor sp. XY-223]|uniref:heparan-alpha-glucosaminide N-acetyltransferase n=1 Tax=Nitratireductor sp. XY-223 TaxID=2561926 RepID=UPI0010A9B097|nr:heparan-alpha-glucosaminide N-acetyltransferase [Nitratireductor sp. XY-223]
MTDATVGISAKQRLTLIDAARGTALLAMAIYHFTWDLEFFGYVSPGLTTEGGWKLFARLIAGSFLFLVGVSLVLAHRNGIRWPSFAKRLLMIVAAALAITVATRFATPDRYIFFGILHCIAVSSIIGLAFLPLPPAVTAVAGVAAILAPHYLASPFFSQDWLLWLGLSSDPVRSNDYVPILPWFGPVLLGMAMAKAGEARGLFAWIASIDRRESAVEKPLAFAGRHSLAVYLIHQPVLIGLVYLASLVIPAPAADPAAGFLSSCNATCTPDNSAEFCSRFCDCTLSELRNAGLLEKLLVAESELGLAPEVSEIVNACTASVLEGNQTE